MAVNTHEGNELELLLAGTKPLARLTSEPSVDFLQDLSAYEPHVASGRLIHVDVTHHVPSPSGQDIPIISHYFCLPTEEWRIKLMELVNTATKQPNRGGFTTDDLHRIDGHLLGYTKASIEEFIANYHQWQKENRARLAAEEQDNTDEGQTHE